MRRKILIACAPATQAIHAGIRTAATAWSELRVRKRALITLLAATGLRINEALTLALHDVDLDADVLRVTGKYRAR
jgi:site-specific recombinase XerD